VTFFPVIPVPPVLNFFVWIVFPLSSCQETPECGHWFPACLAPHFQLFVNTLSRNSRSVVLSLFPQAFLATSRSPFQMVRRPFSPFAFFPPGYSVRLPSSSFLYSWFSRVGSSSFCLNCSHAEYGVEAWAVPWTSLSSGGGAFSPYCVSYQPRVLPN